MTRFSPVLASPNRGEKQAGTCRCLLLAVPHTFRWLARIDCLR
jgi:hypothetical protein